MAGRERLKPDLIVESGLSRYVIEVSVRFEDNGSLELAAREKVNKYLKLKNLFVDNKAFKIHWSRGTIPQGTKRALNKLVLIDKGRWRTMSLIALRSIEIANAHLDYQ